MRLARQSRPQMTSVLVLAWAAETVSGGRTPSADGGVTPVGVRRALPTARRPFPSRANGVTSAERAPRLRASAETSVSAEPVVESGEEAEKAISVPARVSERTSLRGGGAQVCDVPNMYCLTPKPFTDKAVETATKYSTQCQTILSPRWPLDRRLGIYPWH